MMKLIFKTVLIAGTLDILAATINFFIQTGKGPVPVLKYISSGLFGAVSAKNNPIMPFVGLLLHFFIVFIFTVFYFYLASKLLNRLKYWQLAGLVYGAFVWFVMNKIVVPLSLIPSRPSSIGNDVIQLLILMVCIGLPIAYFSKNMIQN
jgi:hypothetical protein